MKIGFRIQRPWIRLRLGANLEINAGDACISIDLVPLASVDVSASWVYLKGFSFFGSLGPIEVYLEYYRKD